MQKLMVIAIALGLAACGKKGGLDGKLDELQKIKDEVCACKDKACADAAHDKYTAWKKNNSKEDKPSDDQMKKFSELRDQLNECRHKLSDTAAPTAPTGSATPTETAPPAPAGSAQ
ncbi:MAG: lipoprotein [Kofleriaceae bacterium]